MTLKEIDQLMEAVEKNNMCLSDLVTEDQEADILSYAYRFLHESEAAAGECKLQHELKCARAQLDESYADYRKLNARQVDLEQQQLRLRSVMAPVIELAAMMASRLKDEESRVQAAVEVHAAREALLDATVKFFPENINHPETEALRQRALEEHFGGKSRQETAPGQSLTILGQAAEAEAMEENDKLRQRNKHLEDLVTDTCSILRSEFGDRIFKVNFKALAEAEQARKECKE